MSTIGKIVSNYKKKKEIEGILFEDITGALQMVESSRLCAGGELRKYDPYKTIANPAHRYVNRDCVININRLLMTRKNLGLPVDNDSLNYLSHNIYFLLAALMNDDVIDSCSVIINDPTYPIDDIDCNPDWWNIINLVSKYRFIKIDNTDLGCKVGNVDGNPIVTLSYHYTLYPDNCPNTIFKI